MSIAKFINSLLPGLWRLHHPRHFPIGAEDIIGRATAVRPYAYLNETTAITRLHDGHIIFVDPADEVITPHLIANGFWEPEVEHVVRRQVRRGQTVIEVGANLGYYTLIMTYLAGASGRVHCYEANPRMVRLLKKSVDVNGYAATVSLHGKAVSNTSGTIEFATTLAAPGGGAMHFDGAPRGEDTIIFNVPVVTLDEEFPEGAVDFLRTDAEGAEALILAGAMNLISRSPAISICCEWDMSMMDGKGDAANIVERLSQQGFRFWRIVTRGDLQEVTPEAMLEPGHFNVFISRRPQERAD